MRNAQKAALMALFASMEQDEEERARAPAEPRFGPANENAKRIEVDLMALALRRVKQPT